MSQAMPETSSSDQPGRIIDLFAGAGGWEEGLAGLGLRAVGIELDGSACATAQAAGHERMQADVVSLAPERFAPVWGLVGSPPCQAYSTAGKGLGRVDKPVVVACAKELAAGNDTRDRRRAQCADPRSLLTVEPLRYALALRPRWIALEQVPAVHELWSVFADLLKSVGYYAVAGALSAERYGVPQTRKRAFLIASLDGQIALPPATHRSYNPRRHDLPADEKALKPWVSMAEALGWTACQRIGFPRRAGTRSHPRSAEGPAAYRQRDRRPAAAPALTLTARTRSWTRVDCSDSTGWTGRRPAPTVVASRRSSDGALIGRQLAPGESTACGGWAWRNGNQPNAALRPSETPAPTIHFGHSASHFAWVLDGRQGGSRPRGISQPAPTMLASGLAKGVPVWAAARPATTVACDRRVAAPGPKRNAQRPDAPGRSANAVRVTVEQAAVLQSFRADYPWQGAKTRRFEQVGNAVPPLLARRVVEAAIRHSSCLPLGERVTPNIDGGDAPR